MSVAGYLSAGGALPRMARKTGEQIGAEFCGAVLRGALTAAERRALEASGAMRVDGERHFSVSEYDPVLRAHCRLDGV